MTSAPEGSGSVAPGEEVPIGDPSTGSADVDAVLAQLAGLDLTAAPAGLLPPLLAAHDALADRLRAVQE